MLHLFCCSSKSAFLPSGIYYYNLCVQIAGSYLHCKAPVFWVEGATCAGDGDGGTLNRFSVLFIPISLQSSF